MSGLRALALAVLASAALTGAARPAATVFDLSDAVGKRAPAVALIAADGTPLSLAALRGKPVYVFLFAGWCAPCQDSLPFVRAAFAKYGDRVQFLGVDVLDTPEAARAAIAAAALPFPVAIYSIEELDAVVTPAAQARAATKYRIPADFLLDANGVVRFAWHGLAFTGNGDPIDLLPSALAKLGIE